MIAGTLFFPYYLLLRQSGERAAPTFIASGLAGGNNCIYSPATAWGTEASSFKPLQYDYLKPKIAIVGSSRSMQFKNIYFQKESFTFGGAVKNVNDLSNVVSDLLNIHRPEAVILQVDYWWFFSKYRVGEKPKNAHIHKEFINSIMRAYKPYLWLAEGKVTLKKFIDAVTGQQKKSCAGMASGAYLRTGGM